MKKVLPLIPLLFAVSCQPKADESAAENSAPPAAQDTTPAKPMPEQSTAALDPAKPESLVGHPLKKVQTACDEAKILHRVVIVDGEGLPTTMDMRRERLNFTVEKGIVTKVTNG